MAEGPRRDAQRPTPSAVDDVAGYVRQLRKLKAWAGDPSFDRLAKVTGIPRSTLSDALSPKRTRLPSIDVVMRYARACGCDEDEIAQWQDVWRRIQAATSTTRTRRSEESEAPLQLPPPPRHFVSRREELRALDALVSECAKPASMPIAVIDGSPDTGNTALAMWWAHRQAEPFPGGRLFVNLRGYDPTAAPVEPADAIRGLLETMGVPGSRIPTSEDALIAFYRSVLATERCSSYWTTRETSPRCGRCCPAAPGAWSW